jgi:PAS domain S-box-containing protein
MKKNQSTSAIDAGLRSRAERKLREQQRAEERPLKEIDVRALVHELQVHQIELEMQNEELIRAQTAAQAAADNYTYLFDFAPIGYFVIDSLGLILEVNLAGAALLGLDRHRVTGQHFEQYLVSDSRAAFDKFWRGLPADEGENVCEVRLLVHGHDCRDALVQVSTVERQFSQNQGRRLALMDITERKHAEQKLQQLNAELERRVAERTRELEHTVEVLYSSEERYRLLFQNLQEGFYLGEAIFDASGQCCDAVYLEVNPALEKILGRPREQIIGKRIKELVPQVDPGWLEVFGKVTRTGEPTTYLAYSMMFKQYFEAFVFRPVPGQFAALVTDVTERKQAEDALQANNRDLERFNRAMIGRELRMIEMKKEVNELCRQAGQPPRYPVNAESDPAGTGT